MQAGRLWSQLLHNKLEEDGFSRCATDMFLYYKRMGNDMKVVGVYVDDLIVTATTAALVQGFSFLRLIKDLGEIRKFVNMRIELDERNGYTSINKQHTSINKQP